MRNPLFSTRLNRQWRWWAVKQTAISLFILSVCGSVFWLFLADTVYALLLMLATSFVWFRVKKRYSLINSLAISIGAVAAYGGLILFEESMLLGLVVMVTGFCITLRFFSEGPKRELVPEKRKQVTKEKKGKNKRPP